MNFTIETQITVRIENKLGQLADITEQLSSNDIYIKAISTIGDEMRFICDDTDKATALLEKSNYKVSKDEVISIKLTDSKGRLSKITQQLADSGINIDYVYAITAADKSSAKLILKVSNIPMAKRILDQHERGAA